MWRYAGAPDYSEVLKIDGPLAMELGAGGDVKEGVAAFLEKRKPRFPGRVSNDMPRVPWDGEASEIRIPYHGDVALKAVVVDPDDHVLLDEDPKNNFMTALAQPRAGAPRSFERVLYWMELALQAVLP